MSTYTSTPTVVNRPILEMYQRFDDLTMFASKLEQLPEEQRAKIGDVSFTKDSIAINTPQIGQLRFDVTERIAPTKVVFGTASSPVPLTMAINFKTITDDTTEVTTVIDVELPAMLRPFVGPKMQQAADQFGVLMSRLAD